jgi:hypothetical protein
MDPIDWTGFSAAKALGLNKVEIERNGAAKSSFRGWGAE